MLRGVILRHKSQRQIDSPSDTKDHLKACGSSRYTVPAFRSVWELTQRTTSFLPIMKRHICSRSPSGSMVDPSLRRILETKSTRPFVFARPVGSHDMTPNFASDSRNLAATLRFRGAKYSWARSTPCVEGSTAP